MLSVSIQARFFFLLLFPRSSVSALVRPSQGSRLLIKIRFWFHFSCPLTWESTFVPIVSWRRLRLICSSDEPLMSSRLLDRRSNLRWFSRRLVTTTALWERERSGSVSVRTQRCYKCSCHGDESKPMEMRDSVKPMEQSWLQDTDSSFCCWIFLHSRPAAKIKLILFSVGLDRTFCFHPAS